MDSRSREELRSQLVCVRGATPEEREEEDAEVVMVRLFEGRQYRIFGSRAGDSWMQWGAPLDVLKANVLTMDRWRTAREGQDGPL